MGHLKAYVWYLPGQAPRKHSVKCENQIAMSTKDGLQLVLRILYFPKPDSPQSKPGVSSAIGGRGSVPKKASCSGLVHRKGPDLYRPVNKLILTSPGSRSTNEECQFSEDQGPRVLPHKRRHSNPVGISLCRGPSHQD